MTDKQTLHKIDETDKQILKLLQHDASQSIEAIAKTLNLSTTPVWRRINTLKQQGLIKQVVSLLEFDMLNLDVEVFIQIEITDHHVQLAQQFIDGTTKQANVIGFYRTMGATDYLVHAVFQNMNEYDSFYQLLATSPIVQKVTATLVLDRIKNQTALPIHHL